MTRATLTETLGRLISIPSVNPMGRDVTGPPYLEARLTDHLDEVFRSLALPTLRQEVAPGRENILARLDSPAAGTPDERILLWDVHQDTVPVRGMTIDPFKPLIEKDRVYGRGACDVKGGMAVMLVALARLAQQKHSQLPTVVLACTVNEEHGFSGATELTQLWSAGVVDPFLRRRPDACIVAEPTRLQVVVSHKGMVRWRCHVTGRAAHSSHPDRGRNAIYGMSQIVHNLQQHAEKVLPARKRHHRCGHPTLSVGTITGGVGVNTVPDHCTIEIDRRLTPDESPRQAYLDAVNAAATADGVDVLHDAPFMQSCGLSDANNAELAANLGQAVERQGIDCHSTGVSYGTNAAAISASGVSTVVFGPGSIDQAHTADEWIEIGQMETACDALVAFATDGDA